MSDNAKSFGACIGKLIRQENMSREESKEMFLQVLKNEQSDLQQGAFLAALTAKGETAEEIAGSWEAIYETDTVQVKPEVPGGIVENCGTGMDTIKTFNISTAASVVAACAGIPMAKHGARAITSVCGTVDILEELGVDVECDPEVVKTSIEKAGIGIFNGMSSKVHPMALGRILSQISFGTTLNIAASLANPALPQYAVRGVYAKELVKPVAQVMKEIGYKKAIVVYGMDRNNQYGMDEASTLGETIVAQLRENGSIENYFFTPEDMGIRMAEASDLAPIKDRRNEAKRLVSLLMGSEQGPRLDIVCLNAALILYLMDKCASIKEGCYLANDIISSGRAFQKLEDWVREQNAEPELGLEKLYAIKSLVS